MTTLFYWTWLVIYIIRTLMNLNVFIKQGDAAMELFYKLCQNKFEANILANFTFGFEIEGETDLKLIRLIKITN